MSQLEQKSASNADPKANDPRLDDPLARLHKMSTTAGLGSAEYVAVSGWAIFCVITGLASALALMADLLLIIPALCLISAVVALRQISRSNGTQTGKGLVALGVLCALVFGGGMVVRDATAGIRTRSDRQVISELIPQFGDKIKAGDFTGAYGMFSQHFRDRVTQEEFNSKLKPFREGPLIGKLLGTSWNGLADFGLEGNTAVINLRFTFDKNKPYDALLYLRKYDGKWFFDDMPDFFPPAAPEKK